MDLHATSTQSLAAVVALMIVSSIMFGITTTHAEPQLTENSVTPTPTFSPSVSLPASPEPSVASAPTPVVTMATPTPVPTAAPVSYAYRNGSYTAVGTYSVPGHGSEKITVTVTLTNDAITASTVTVGANNRESQEYQTAFIGGYKPYVIGKTVSALSLGRISGSSLTPKGFNNALTQIRAQAKK